MLYWEPKLPCEITTLFDNREVPYICKETACGRPGFSSWIWKIPWRREQLYSPLFLPGEFQGQRSLVGYKSMGLQSQTQLSANTFTMFAVILYRKKEPGHGHNDLGYNYKSFFSLIKDINFGDIKNRVQTK